MGCICEARHNSESFKVHSQECQAQMFEVGKIEHEPRYGDNETITGWSAAASDDAKLSPIRLALTLNEYQRQASMTDKGHELSYYALGLGGETGEVLEKIKKLLRDDEGALTDERQQALKLELGDVLWYAALLARKLGLTFEEVAQANLNKLASRKERGVLTGDGDDR